jgi:hypothetical protein
MPACRPQVIGADTFQPLCIQFDVAIVQCCDDEFTNLLAIEAGNLLRQLWRRGEDDSRQRCRQGKENWAQPGQRELGADSASTY